MPALCIVLTASIAKSQPPGSPLGIFEDHNDVGTVLHPGTVSYNSSDHSYTLTGSGENMWAATDAFHFLWKKAQGDISFTADISFPTQTGNPHKKAVLMIRQSLDPGSAYVDAALHVAGLTSLQSRAEANAATHEIGLETEAATRLRLEKRGDDFYLFVARAGERLHLAGGSMHLALQAPFYIGLGVCAHDKDSIETAVFSNVTIEKPTRGRPKLFSTLETISVSSTDRRVVAVFPGQISTPNWSTDGSQLLFRNGKQWMQIPPAGGSPQPASQPSEPAQAKNSPRPSPDGQREVSLSYWGKEPMEASLNLKTIKDGATKLLAKLLAAQGTLGTAAWSPDGKRVVFVSYQRLPKE